MNLHLRISSVIISAILLTFSTLAEDRSALVKISGEVVFPGQYLIRGTCMKAADVIAEAGGLAPDAYPAGIVLFRGLTDEEYSRVLLACRLAEEQLSGLDVKLQIPDKTIRYSVSSTECLRAGDEVVVPKQSFTVRISGAVNFPTVVTFAPEASVDDYILMAGGLAENAERGGIYVLHPSGEKVKRSRADIVPGSEIFVPSDGKSGEKVIFAEEILSICTSTASVTQMVIGIVELIND